MHEDQRRQQDALGEQSPRAFFRKALIPPRLQDSKSPKALILDFLELQMDTDFPEGQTASLKLTAKSPKRFTLALRRPYWAGAGFSVKVNGKAVGNLPKADSYVELNRNWKSGDSVELVLPKALREEPLPDNPRRVSLMWGPLVLAGDLGPEQRGGRGRGQGGSEQPATPVFIAAEQPVAEWLKPAAGKPGNFHTQGVGQSQDVDFVPFYRLPNRRYGIYWDLFTPEEWQKKGQAYAAEQEKMKKLEAATVALAQPGQMQTERDFNLQGDESSPVQLQGRYGRRGTKWFSFDLPVDPAHPMVMQITYSNDGPRRAFDILVEGKKVGEQVMERRSPEQDVLFFEVEYAIPAELVKGKQKVTIRFEATGGSAIASVFGIRMVRADAQR
jgi:hypothetical protein